jgi:hypothetical protein
MNDGTLAARILNELADIVEKWWNEGGEQGRVFTLLRKRALELDPPEKNEVPK